MDGTIAVEIVLKTIFNKLYEILTGISSRYDVDFGTFENCLRVFIFKKKTDNRIIKYRFNRLTGRLQRTNVKSITVGLHVWRKWSEHVPRPVRRVDYKREYFSRE